MRKRWLAFLLTLVMLFGLFPAQTQASTGQTGIEQIILNQSAVTLEVGQSTEIEATILPQNAAVSVHWGTENERIVTVGDGVITAVGEGSTRVTVQAGAITAICNVTVLAASNKNSRVTPTTIYTGQSKPDATIAYVSSITVEQASVEKYTWVDDDAYVVLSPETSDNTTVGLTFQTGGKVPPELPDTEVVLSGGRAQKSFSASAGWKGSWDFTIHFSNKGYAPVLAGSKTLVEHAYIGETYELDLSSLYMDVFDKALTYFVKEGQGEYQKLTGSVYRITPDTAGTRILTIKANNGTLDSQDVCTVQLTAVERTDATVTVRVPEYIQPLFYTTDGYDSDGYDRPGDALTASQKESSEGFTEYHVSVGNLTQTISVRGKDGNDVNLGGMAVTIPESGVVTLRQVQSGLTDLGGKSLEGSVSVDYGAHKAYAGADGSYLLAVGESYIYTSAVADADFKDISEAYTLESGAQSANVVLKLEIKNAKSITVTTGARAQLYNKVNYYSYAEYEPKVIADNGDGTSTYYFVANGSDMSWRVSMEGKITKAGYWNNDQTECEAVYKEADAAPTYRPDYFTSGQENSGVAEDSVLLNINGQNHLTMKTGDSKILKAYRVWELVESYMNHVIMPDFNYSVLSGEDVVSLSAVESPSNGDGDWMQLTALKDGIAVIEVTYDAIEISGGDYDGVYGASDPARSGLVVVQVGNTEEIDFGIDCFASESNPVDGSYIPYDSNKAREWDAEFDTLYFTEDCGQIMFSPQADTAITEVAVSNDKGNSWKTLTAKDGVYTAVIVPGNNILRVSTENSTAYQVIRGDRVTVVCKEVAEKSDGDGILEAGETVRVTLKGLHTPIPKLSGNYNPGFGANEDGYSSIHLNYTLDEKPIYSSGAQYDFITAANSIELVIPEDEENSVVLTDGYIGVGVIGLTEFAVGGDSHRNIPDEGCSTRGNITTFHTRSILPEVTITVGSEAAPNSAPTVAGGAVTAASIKLGQNYAVNPEFLFEDEDGDPLTFQVSVNEEEADSALADYKFAPQAVGTYRLTFTASDGKEQVSHTIVLQVIVDATEDYTPEFDLKEPEIDGYVTISFEDYGIRRKDETGLKFPVPLGMIVEATQVPFQSGESIARVTLRLLDAFQIGCVYGETDDKGFYLSAIQNFVVDNTPYVEMGEFDAGSGSGWMVTWNKGGKDKDWFIDKGASEFTVTEGDIIRWQYTCQLGADIGDNASSERIDTVECLIEEIGTVSLEREAAISAARTAYDELTQAQQKQVENYSKLEAAEKALAQLKATVEDKKAVSEVEELIAAIGEVTENSESEITAARNAYNALTDTQQKLVKNYGVLRTAENQLLQLKNPSHTAIYEATGNYLSGLGTPSVGFIGGEWMSLGLARSGRIVSDGYYNNVAAYVKENINAESQLHISKSTENSRIILALTAVGLDPARVEEYNLLNGLTNLDYVKKQGVNGPIWALLALDSHHYTIPATDAANPVTRTKLVDTILAAQLRDYGWSLSGERADADLTAMAIQALAPYYAINSKVKNAVDSALTKLSAMQYEDGSFGSTDGKCAESCAQVIVALTALNIHPEEDKRFVKNGNSVVDALCAFAADGGGFKHTLNGKRDGMATEQGFYALVAYMRFLTGDTSLYDMSDVILKTGSITDTDNVHKEDKNAAEKVEKRIDAIGKVTVNSGVKIKAARSAYNNLTAAQKKLVSNYDDLTMAEAVYADLRASNVEKLIDAIGTVSKNSEARIKKARVAFTKLASNEQNLVENYEYLLYAEAALEEAKVVYVEELIDSVGNVTLNSRSKISRARTAYNNLSAGNKNAVSNLNVLLEAEATYARLAEESKTTDKNTSATTSKPAAITDKPIAATEDAGSELTKIAEKVKAMLESMDDDSLAGELCDAIMAYEELTDDEKESIDQEDLVEALKEQLCEMNQTDTKNGISVMGCDWKIQLVADEISNVTQMQILQERLGCNQIIKLWDIYLKDIITGKHYQPDGSATVKIPLELLGEYSVYDGLVVVHFTVDGKVEYLNSTVVGDCIVFSAVDFSHYAVAGYVGESPLTDMDVVNDDIKYDGTSWPNWVIGAGCGVVLLAVLLFYMMKNKKEQAGR
ncbi:MAG: hypothetical protein E7292_11895 [Lachnospiraceae bacterium]|nr:hypothetical protein [Lachnospiraceae bacterium]